MIRPHKKLYVTFRLVTDQDDLWRDTHKMRLEAALQDRTDHSAKLGMILGISNHYDRLTMHMNGCLGDFSFDSWAHYALIIDKSLLFTNLGTRDPDYEAARQKLVDYVRDGTLPDNYVATTETDPEDIVF